MAQGRPKNTNHFENLEEEIGTNQSKLSMVLGALIILVVGILIFNYFNRGNRGDETLGPAQQTQEEDVSPNNLPGKYTVKENDTLFLIAQKYYMDGYKYEEIAKANNLKDVNAIEAGQVLDIPKLAEEIAEIPLPSLEPGASLEPQATETELGIGGGNTTIWGSRITQDSYTVQQGDWLSKIAGRAYGDIWAYKKLAEVNNIPNPDLIFPGQVIKIPRP